MSLPTVTIVAPGSPAEQAGVRAGDEVLRLNGQVPRDIIEWRFLVDEAEVELDIRRGNVEMSIEVSKNDGEPLGAEVGTGGAERRARQLAQRGECAPLAHERHRHVAPPPEHGLLASLYGASMLGLRRALRSR